MRAVMFWSRYTNTETRSAGTAAAKRIWSGIASSGTSQGRPEVVPILSGASSVVRATSPRRSATMLIRTRAMVGPKSAKNSRNRGPRKRELRKRLRV